MAIGFDAGTFNLVCSRRGEANEVKSRKEVNCFIEIPLDNPFMYNMLEAASVKLIKRDKVAYIVGQRALDIAYTLPTVQVRRPMKDGCLNPQEKDALDILRRIIQSLIGEVSKDKEILYYSVPANAVNEKTNTDWHQKVLESIFKSYKVNDKTVVPYPINEALALVFAELADKAYTGIGISFGAGMQNLCYAVMSVPVFTMSLVNSGDWIDEMSAQASGESVAFINKLKTTVDLTKAPSGMAERAIHTHYRILVDRAMTGIKKGLAESGNKVRSENPLDIVLAGGTASPNGFEDLVREVVKELKFPIPIGEIRKPKDHLYAVARGCLVAAENAMVN